MATAFDDFMTGMKFGSDNLARTGEIVRDRRMQKEAQNMAQLLQRDLQRANEANNVAEMQGKWNQLQEAAASGQDVNNDLYAGETANISTAFSTAAAARKQIIDQYAAGAVGNKYASEHIGKVVQAEGAQIANMNTVISQLGKHVERNLKTARDVHEAGMKAATPYLDAEGNEVVQQQRTEMGKDLDPRQRLDLRTQHAAREDAAYATEQSVRGKGPQTTMGEVQSDIEQGWIPEGEVEGARARARTETKAGGLRVSPAGPQSLTPEGIAAHQKGEPLRPEHFKKEAAQVEGDVKRQGVTHSIINFLGDLRANPEGDDSVRGAFGLTGALATHVGGLAGNVFGKEEGDAVSKWLAGKRMTQIEIGRTRLALQTLVAGNVPQLTGEQSGRITDAEYERTNEAVRLLSPTSSADQAEGALERLLIINMLSNDRLAQERGSGNMPALDTKEDAMALAKDLARQGLDKGTAKKFITQLIKDRSQRRSGRRYLFLTPEEAQDNLDKQMSEQ